MISNRSTIDPKSVAKGFGTVFVFWSVIEIASKTPRQMPKFRPSEAKTLALLSPKSILKRLGKRFRNEVLFETDFGQIFDRFWSRRRKFLIQILCLCFQSGRDIALKT